MKRIIFHERVFSSGGTTKALLDYAYYNRINLENDSFLAFHHIEDTKNTSILKDTINRLQENFSMIFYSDYQELQNYIDANNIDYHYTIKSGEREGFLSYTAKNLVHAVFPQGQDQKHGNVYAYVSEWLSKNCDGNFPFVPHILPDTTQYLVSEKSTKDFRNKYGIPLNAKVFGRIGSYNEFNIPFVYEVIEEVLNLDKNIWFVFCNTKEFLKHPRIIYIPSIYTVREKFQFIESCDAMIHARMRGETFGISVGEFSIRNKPVLTYQNSIEKAHIDILGSQGFYYTDKFSLLYMLLEVDLKQNQRYDAYEQFSPKFVMNKFDEVFLK